MMKRLIVTTMVLGMEVTWGTTPRVLFEHVETKRNEEPSDAPAARYRTKYRSTAIDLLPGQVILSDPDATPLTMPKGSFWLRGLSLEVVNASGAQVPLTEIYLHHVAIYDGSKGADVCGGANLDARDALWDVGAESRGLTTFFRQGFGYLVNEDAKWSGNIHLIRTDDVQNVKACIECKCPQGGGSEVCCPDGTLCPLVAGSKAIRKSYFVEYVVHYDPIDSTTLLTTPLKYRTLDAAACQLEFNVPAVCPWSFHHSGTTVGSVMIDGDILTGSGRFQPSDFLLDDVADLPAHCIATKSWSMIWREDDGRLIFGKGHLHIGAIDMSLSIQRPGSSPELLCTVVPRYGTELGVPGNELGYVVGVSNCDDFFADMPVLRRGDRLTVSARYRAQPWYDGVMGLFDIAVAPYTDAFIA